MVGAISGDVDVSKIVDTRFLPDDLKALQVNMIGAQALAAQVSLRGCRQGLPPAGKAAEPSMRSARSISICGKASSSPSSGRPAAASRPCWN